MPAILRRLALAALLLALSAPAFAIEMSADVVRVGGGRTEAAKVFIKHEKVRLESPDGPLGPGYSLLRQDKKLMWLVQPGPKTYIELPLEGLADMSQQAISGGKLPGELLRRELGRPSLDGRPTIKYEVIYGARGQNHMIHQWLAPDLGIPIKTAGADGSWSVEYQNIRVAPQPDGIFELPEGYRRLGLPELIQALGGGPAPPAAGAAPGAPAQPGAGR
ncbi:MAG: hypothetical protein ACOZHQ_10855 [Thermodesulfobacteriota bacterium]